MSNRHGILPGAMQPGTEIAWLITRKYGVVLMGMSPAKFSSHARHLSSAEQNDIRSVMVSFINMINMDNSLYAE
jgi:hypothetical protein